MYLYKIRWFNDDGKYVTREGMVAGISMEKACATIEEYYGVGAVEAVTLAALESGEGILDFEEIDGVTWGTFLPDEEIFPKNS